MALHFISRLLTVKESQSVIAIGIDCISRIQISVKSSGHRNCRQGVIYMVRREGSATLTKIGYALTLF